MIVNYTLITPFFLVATWQIIITLFNVTAYLCPSPADTAIALWSYKSQIIQHLCITLTEMFSGLGLATFLALITALLMDRINLLKKAIYPICLTLQSMPSFILMPLLLMWIGFGFLAKIIVIVLATYFSLTLALINGLAQTPRIYIEQAKLMHAHYLYTLIYIRLPFALPSFLTGLRIVMVHAPVTAIAADWIGANEGLGYLILVSHSQMEIDFVFACIIVLIVTVFFINRATLIIDAWVTKKMRLNP